MNKYLFVSLLAILLLSQFVGQKDYYSSIDGVKGGKELKDALHNLIKEHKQIPYGSGVSSTWGAFYVTDAVEEEGRRRVIDMYSGNVRYFDGEGSSVDGMNIEHSVAKSWWGGGENDAYFDLHHLNPADAEANGRKNNYPLGELTSVTWQNGVAFVGKADIAGVSQNAYEPCDEYKGDFARIYMYIFTCYQNLKWKYTWMNYAGSTYPTLKPWAVEMLLRWHRQDPVSQMEIERNNAVYRLQGNRNPFVDYPQLADYVWGDSTDFTFHIGDGPIYEAPAVEAGSKKVVETPDNAGFALLDDPSRLSVGDTVIIVSDGVAISTEQRTANRGATPVSVKDKTVAAPSPNVQLIVVEQGVYEGTFAFNAGGGYLCAPSNSSNVLRTQPNVDDKASWRLAGNDNGTVDIVAQCRSAHNRLRYNAKNKVFSCYKKGQGAVAVYVKLRNAK